MKLARSDQGVFVRAAFLNHRAFNNAERGTLHGFHLRTSSAGAVRWQIYGGAVRHISSSREGSKDQVRFPSPTSWPSSEPEKSVFHLRSSVAKVFP